MPNPKRRHSKTRTAKRRTHDALKAYGLHIDWVNCQHFDTNLAGPYLFCPLTRIPGMHA